MSAKCNIEVGFYGKPHYKIDMDGFDEEELRFFFEDAVSRMFPKLNKFQAYIYGDRNFDSKAIRDIVVNNRGMGKTTAHAMKQIAEAIQNPGKEIKLCNDKSTSVHAMTKCYINDHVKPMIEKLGLKFMVIDGNRQTLKFDV